MTANSVAIYFLCLGTTGSVPTVWDSVAVCDTEYATAEDVIGPSKVNRKQKLAVNKTGEPT
jgi:hypothetical protein